MKLYKNREWLEKEYCEKGRRLEDLGEQFGITRTSIFQWIKKFKLKRERIIITKPNKRKYNLDVDYFKKIDTEEKAYWLGFIAADGCVRYRVGCRILTIELSKKDEEHLEKFRKAIKYEGPIRQKKERVIHNKKWKDKNKIFITKPSVSLTICHCDFVKNLIDQGIMENKTKLLQPPKIAKKYYRHWIRGLFDGDGSVSFVHDGYIRGEFIGTKNVIKWIVKQFDCSEVVGKRKEKELYCHSFGCKEARTIRYYLYDNSKVFLERKKEVFYNKES